MTLRRVALAAACLVVLTASPVRAATLLVTMKGLKYTPAVSRVNISDSVTWSNDASDRHTTTSAGPTPWDSGRMNPWGGRFTHTFPIAGTFPFYCTIHKSVGMTGRILVAPKVAPTRGTTATDFVVTLAGAGVKPPTGYVFVAEKALGDGAYSTLVRTSAASARFRLPAAGTYRVRTGLQKSTGAANAAWFSEPVTLSVG